MPFKAGASVRDVNRNIEEFASKTIPRRIRKELYILGKSLGNFADFYVPVDTKNLVNSRKETVSFRGNYFTASVGYYTAHALPLHSPQKGGKMDGWKPMTPEDREYKTRNASNFVGGGIGGFNINAKQGWLNIAWEWKGDELLEDFANGIIKK